MMMCQPPSLSPSACYNALVLSSLEPGDLVEFPRYGGAYSHWAVYIGNGKVIHFSADGSDFGQGRNFNQALALAQSQGKFDNTTVREDDFKKVCGDSIACKNNKTDPPLNSLEFLWQGMGYIKPYSGQTVVERAKSRLGEGGYNLLTNNCEHFANWCRYGKSISYQVDAWLSWFKPRGLPGMTFNAM